MLLMSHVPEMQFKQSVVTHFRDRFKQAKINTEPRLHLTGRYPDIIVDFGDFAFVVEVENDFESAYKAGVGQAINYATEYMQIEGKPTVAVLVVPNGHIEEPEWTIMREMVVCLEVEHE